MKNFLNPPRSALVGAATLTALSFAFAAPAKAITVFPVDWTGTPATNPPPQTAVSTGTFVGGPLNGTGVTLTGAVTPQFPTQAISQTQNLSGANFSYAPLSATQEVIRFERQSDVTAAFTQPVPNLLFYAFILRGNPSAPITYTFNQTGVIRSGFSDSGVTFNGTVLTVPSVASLANGTGGIIEFVSPTSSLGFISSATSAGATPNQNVITFATPVPLETDALPILGSAAFMAGGLWWKKKRAGAKALHLAPTDTVKG